MKKIRNTNRSKKLNNQTNFNKDYQKNLEGIYISYVPTYVIQILMSAMKHLKMIVLYSDMN